MQGRRKLSNPLALAVLALLAERSMHPYEMAATLRERHKEESIKLRYGSLYTVIEGLERAGYIQATRTTREGNRPERTIYAITRTGEAELRDWMREILSTPVHEYPQFEAGLSLLPVLPPEEVVSLLETRLEFLKADLQRLRAGLREAQSLGLPPLFTIENEYRLACTEAERSFVQRLIPRIEKDGCGFLTEWQEWHRTRTPPSKPRRTDHEQSDR
jgi:DNA-binding PadR family transcriptional regulator